MRNKDKFEVNTKDLLFLQKKYYTEANKDNKKQKVMILMRIIFSQFFKRQNKQKKTIHYGNDITRKINRIPTIFLKHFDQNDYLLINPDINDDIEKGEFKSPLEHFILLGYDQVKKGLRQLGSDFPKISEEDYIEDNPDVKEAFDQGLINSGFEHFLCLGHAGTLEKCSNLKYLKIKTPNILDYDVLIKFKKIFDEAAYLKANLDVSEMIEQGVQKNGWGHFLQIGHHEIREGTRSLHERLKPMSEISYITTYLDIKNALDNNTITSAFEHFLFLGHKEMLEGTRQPSSSLEYIYYQPVLTTLIEEELSGFIHAPLISIIMPVYNVDPTWLKRAIKSIQNQWYPNWELCIADDCSSNKDTIAYLSNVKSEKIKIKYLHNNLNICGASNEAIKLADGEFIALMDNDDELTPDALYEVVKAINDYGAEFIYSDEDKLEMDGTFSDHNFKPDYSHDTFLSTNYISHLTVIKKSLIDEVDGWEPGLEGSQDFDLYLKVLEHTNKIIHIPKVLYHWRKVAGSTAESYGEKSYANDAGRKALENAMKRRKLSSQVIDGMNVGTYRVRYEIQNNPLVSIIIPFKDKPDLLKQCVDSILDKSTYLNIEIIGVSNNSCEERTFKLMNEYSKKDNRISFVEYNVEFNYSLINNYAVKECSKGEYIIFLNNDVMIISNEWIESMLELAQLDKVGAVGAKLYYSDDTVQHAGLITKIVNTVVPAFSKFSRNNIGYSCRLQIINNFSAVTAACMMIKKELFLNMNGFDEDNLKVAYNDVDLCLSLVEKGYRNILTPYAEAYHYESLSRGPDTSIDKIERLSKEHHFLVNKHPSFFVNGDPCYNTNLTETNCDFSVNRIHTNYRDNVIPQKFTEKVTIRIHGVSSRHECVCIFSHFDKNGLISDYVLYYLKYLSKIADIIFVSTAQLSTEDLEPILEFCRDVIVKDNTGYDFGAWKTGIDHLGEEVFKYEQLVICNDSVYGPLYDLSKVFQAMDAKKADVYSITDSQEINQHLQSYFIIFNKNVIHTKQFKTFWTNLCLIMDKQKLIETYELGLSRMFQKAGFKLGSYIETSEITKSNITLLRWKDLIEKYHSPFIKIELLRDNPKHLDLSDFEVVMLESTDYPLKLIKSHLKSIKHIDI